MTYRRLFAGLAVLCLLAGFGLALAKLAPASVDEDKCTGCAECALRCPQGAISFNDDGVAEVDEDKCTGCGRCTRACPVEAIAIEGSS